MDVSLEQGCTKRQDTDTWHAPAKAHCLLSWSKHLIYNRHTKIKSEESPVCSSNHSMYYKIREIFLFLIILTIHWRDEIHWMAPQNYSHKEWLVFMGKDSPPWIEGVVDWVVVEIGEPWGVNVSKAEESAREIGWVVVCSEDAAKAGVKHVLCLFSVEIKAYLASQRNRSTCETYV